jgi:predicted MFS family arabinose efflux permease
MWVAYFLNFTDRQVIFSIFPVLETELRLTPTQQGLTGSMFLWVYALCNPMAGMMGDRFQRRTLIVASLVLWSAITALTGASGSAIMLLACRGLMGFAEAMFFPAAVTLTAHAHAPESRSRAISLFTTAQLGGVVMGGWFGGVMAEHHHWRAAFYVLGLAGALYALPYSLVLGRLGEPAAPPSRAWSIRALFRIPMYLILCVVFPSGTFVIWLIYTWLPKFFFEKFSLPLGEAGFAATVWVQGGTLVGLFLGGVLADRLFRRFRAARFWLVAAALVLCAPSLYLTGNSPSLGLTQAAAAAFGMASGLAIANFFPACFDVLPRATHASAVGILNLLGGLSAGFASLFGGMLKKSVGIPSLMTASAVLCAAMGAILFLGTRRSFDADFCRAREGELS